MPYAKVSDLPDNVKKLPDHAKEIYMAAFNAAFKQYDGNEGRSHGTAWAAVKKEYKQNKNGAWVAKESAVVTEEAMSDGDRRAMLQDAVTGSLAVGNMQSGPWIRDVYPDSLVYEVGGKMFQMAYVIDKKNKVVFGEAERVVATTVYKAAQEAVEAKIEVLTTLSSEREDAVEAKEMLNELLELLEKEDLTDEEVGPFITRADEIIARLEEAAPMKTEEGVPYPRSAFAYAPEADKPSGWKLRMWEDDTKKVTKAQLKMISASLSPGGYKGEVANIDKEALPVVKRKIRAAYKQLGVEDADIPKWVKEAESRLYLGDFTPLTEAKIEKGEAQVIVIRPGFNSSKDRYYPAETLKRDFGIFEGAKMYADHPSNSEEKDRPERSIRDWIGTLKNVTAQEDGTIIGTAAIVEPWMQEKLALLRDKGMLDQLGVSINAVGSASNGTIDGTKTKVIERFIRVRSVDFVTEAGAGGGVALYEAITDTDIDLVDVEEFKSRRPDIVALIETEATAKIQSEVKAKMELEQENKDLKEQVDALTTERDGLKTTIEEAEKAKAKAEAQATIKEAVDKAELPEAAKERLLEAHKEDEDAEGIEEAIKSEVAYIAALTEKGRIKDLGKPGDPQPEKVKEELQEGLDELMGKEAEKK